MKLSDLLPKLIKNEDYQISIADEDNRNIITFNPTGYIGLSAELNDREVDEIQISDNVKIIKIFLKVVDDSEPVTPDPSDPTNPTNP